ncbi:MAG: Fic family protein [Rhodospirillales bacterium]|nr:Fic family protein [Rhodospirillales bacterium]
MPNYSWTPITPLSEVDRKIDLAETRSVYETWKGSKERLTSSSPAGFKEFSNRLVRRLSIETGILERLYDLDRGTTEALVSQGFIEDIIVRSSTNIEPSRLIDILKDHEAAIQLVMDCISGNRPLTTGILHELHSILTKHEETTTAIDQLGNRREIPLLKGKFKEFPNNPRRPDGSVHEYCPPVHVSSEIDNLLTWYGEYVEEDPVIVAAWLHHRFTQIHPYQDGNGRVARALTTLVLLRADLLPLVVDRDLRVEYIKSLEAADACNLSPLASLFARLERAAIMQALSVDADQEITSRKTLTEAVIQNLAQKFGKRREAKHAELRTVNTLATKLGEAAHATLESAFAQLKNPVSEIGRTQIYIDSVGPGDTNAHWYKREVATTAKSAGKFANFAEDHYFVKAAMNVGQERLVFVVSFHHVGRELSGIMEATSFARLESNRDSEDKIADFFICSTEPFVFTYKTSEQGISASFERWLDTSLAIAFKEFGDRL